MQHIENIIFLLPISYQIKLLSEKVGITVGALTAGAGFAIAAGISIAVGTVADVTTGAVYDLASGKSPILESVGTNTLGESLVVLWEKA